MGVAKEVIVVAECCLALKVKVEKKRKDGINEKSVNIEG